jgi:predicted nuclease of predicted toxin-antitoxin system
MRFLIDECLHTSLLKTAHEAGYLCEHVNFLGLNGQKDWELMRTVQAGEYTFVTNNRTDFAALYSQEELHAGLVTIVPNVPPARQRALFQAALSHIAGRDLLNAALEVNIEGATITCREYSCPVS